MLMRTLQAIALCAFCASCGGGGGGNVAPPVSGGSGSPSPSPSPTPTSTAPMHVYIVYGYIGVGDVSKIESFALPLTQASSVAASVYPRNTPSGIAFDPMHRLFVVGNAGTVSVFAAPFVNDEGPNLGFNVQLQPSDVAFDAAGDAFITRSQPTPAGNGTYLGFIDVFNAPITANSTPSFTIGGNGIQAEVSGATFDRSGNLWVSAIATVASRGRIYEYAPPFSAQSTPALSFQADQSGPGIVFDSGSNLYNTGGSGVNVYKPPFTKSTVKSFTISTSAAGAPEYLAFDDSGNLYVTVSGSLLMYTPPFSANSSPGVTLGLFTNNGHNGIAIGP